MQEKLPTASAADLSKRHQTRSVTLWAVLKLALSIFLMLSFIGFYTVLPLASLGFLPLFFAVSGFISQALEELNS